MQGKIVRGFDAFISYKRDTEGRTAAALCHAVRRIGVPFYRRSPLRIFRDDEVLQAGTSLPRSVEQAIRASRYLVVLCSPGAAASPWVDKEIRHFLASAPDAAARILLGITAGHWGWDSRANDFDRTSDAIPAALADVFADEPYVVDLRFLRRPGDASLRKPDFRAAVAALAAPIRGVTKEDLDGAERRQSRRLRIALASVGLLAVGASVVVVELVRNQERLNASAESRKAADLSQVALQQGDYPRAFAQARKAWQIERSAFSSEALLSFWERSRTARLDYPAAGYGRFSHAGRLVATSPSSLVWPAPAGVQVWDLLGRAVGEPLPAGYEFVAFTRDDLHVVVRSALESRTPADVLSAGYDRQAYRSRLELREVGGRKLAAVELNGRWPSRIAAADAELQEVPWESETIATSRDGDTIAIVTPEGHAVVWMRGGEAFVEKLRRPSTVQVDVTAAGDRVLLTGADGKVVLWDLAAGRGRSIEAPAPVLKGRFVPGEHSLLAVSKDAAWVMNLEGRIAATLPLAAPARFIEVSPDGTRLLLESADGTFVVHETANWKREMPAAPVSSELLEQQRTCRRGPGEEDGQVAGRRVMTVVRATPKPVFSADGSRVLRVCGGMIEAWSPYSNVPVRLGLGRVPSFGALSPDGAILLRFDKGQVEHPELQYLQPLLPVSVGHSRLVNAAVPGLEQEGFVTTSEDATACIWNARGHLVARLAHGGAVTSAAISDDRRRILTSSEDRMLRVWSAEGGLLQTFALDEPLIAGLLLTGADRVVAVGRNSVRGWSADGAARFDLRLDAPLNAANASNDGDFATASTSGVTEVWSPDGVSRCVLRHTSSVLATAFSPDGRRVLTVASDNRVRVFDLCREKPIARYEHDGMVVGASWLDDSTIVTAARFGPVRLWRLGFEGPLKVLPAPDRRGESATAYASLNVAPDRRAFVTATRQGLVQVWSVAGALRYDFNVSDLEEVVLADAHRVLVRADRHVEVFRLPSPDDVVREFAGRVRQVPP